MLSSDARASLIILKRLTYLRQSTVALEHPRIQRSAFHCGENKENKTYDSLEFLLRNAEKIETFRDLERDDAAPAARPNLSLVVDL